MEGRKEAEKQKNFKIRNLRIIDFTLQYGLKSWEGYFKK